MTIPVSEDTFKSAEAAIHLLSAEITRFASARAATEQSLEQLTRISTAAEQVAAALKTYNEANLAAVAQIRSLTDEAILEMQRSAKSVNSQMSQSAASNATELGLRSKAVLDSLERLQISGLLAELKSVESRLSSGVLAELNSVESRLSSGVLAELNSVESRLSSGVLAELNSVESRLSSGVLAELNSVESRLSSGVLAELNSVESRLKGSIVSLSDKLVATSEAGDRRTGEALQAQAKELQARLSVVDSLSSEVHQLRADVAELTRRTKRPLWLRIITFR